MSRSKKNAKPLKVDFLRYFVQDLRERLERGEEAMVGRPRADVEKYITLLTRVVDAVDHGTPDDAYYAAWMACAWSVNSSVAIPIAKGRTHLAAHKRKGETRKQTTAQNHAALVSAVAAMRKTRPDASLSKICQAVAKEHDCSERTVYNAWHARIEK